jgi:two-component sensor histidine kinase
MTFVARSSLRGEFAGRPGAKGLQRQGDALVSAVWRNRDPHRATRLLIQELTHRVGREFSAAISTLSNAAAHARSDEALSTLVAVKTRLENFARVHQALQAPEFRTNVDGCEYLQQLCAAISLSRLECRGIELQVLDGVCPIDSEQCWRLGIIVAELVAIAARRAFVTSPGRISVEISRRGALIGCRVEDNGSARGDESDRDTRFVDALARELHGAFKQHHRGDGCVATVIFPAAGRL